MSSASFLQAAQTNLDGMVVVQRVNLVEEELVRADVPLVIGFSLGLPFHPVHMLHVPPRDGALSSEGTYKHRTRRSPPKIKAPM